MAEFGEKTSQVEAFDEHLSQFNLRGHWRAMAQRSSVPIPRAMLWKWADIYPNLMQAGDLIDMDETGRRTLPDQLLIGEQRQRASVIARAGIEEDVVARIIRRS